MKDLVIGGDKQRLKEDKLELAEADIARPADAASQELNFKPDVLAWVGRQAVTTRAFSAFSDS